MTRKQAQPRPYMRKGKQVVNPEGQLGWRLRVHNPRTGEQPESNFYGTSDQAVVELARLRNAMTDEANDQRVDAQSITVGDWAERWLADYAWKVRPEGKNPGMARPETTWVNARNIYLAYIENTPLDKKRIVKLEPEDCYRHVAGLRVHDGKKEASGPTKEKVASILRLILAHAALNKVGDNAARSLPAVWSEGRNRLIIPSFPQVEALAAAMDKEWPGHGNIVRLFAFTGMRWEDAAGLRWKDVNFDMMTMFIWFTATSASGRRVERDVTKTTASTRYATIFEQAMPALTWLKAYADERGSEWVLTGHRGGPLNYSVWRKHLDKAREASGVDYTAHGLRHLCASWMIASGKFSANQVREQMGHSRDGVTQTVYRHAWALDRRALSKALSQAITDIMVDTTAENEPKAA